MKWRNGKTDGNLLRDEDKWICFVSFILKSGQIPFVLLLMQHNLASLVPPYVTHISPQRDTTGEIAFDL